MECFLRFQRYAIQGTSEIPCSEMQNVYLNTNHKGGVISEDCFQYCRIFKKYKVYQLFTKGCKELLQCSDKYLVRDIKPPIYFHQTRNISLTKINDAVKCILSHLQDLEKVG